MTSNRPYLLRAVHEWICDNGLTPYLVVDAGVAGVKVPPQAISDGRVVLNIAPRAVVRLDMGNDAITCMARFGGVSHSVYVPLEAVQAIYARENGQGMLLAEDEPGTAPAVADAEPSGNPSPALQAVPDAGQQDTDGGTATPSTESGESDKPKPKGKPNLRVIK